MPYLIAIISLNVFPEKMQNNLLKPFPTIVYLFGTAGWNPTEQIMMFS
jgi:hypothetical protein